MKIYHFTKLKNAINILKYGKLNFGNLDYSNDPSEGLYPTKVIEKSILNIYGRENTSRNMIALFRINTTLNDDLHIYSISFTSKLDEIHNWMEYGNYGEGVAFEFDLSKLEKLLKKIQMDISLLSQLFIVKRKYIIKLKKYV